MADDQRDSHEFRIKSMEEKRLPWPEESDPERLGESFADPNSLDDGRLGKSFEESNSRGKKKKMPVAQPTHKTTNRRPLMWFLIGFACVFLLVVVVGYLMRRGDREDADRLAKAHREAKPVVQVVKVQAAKDQAGLVVPGTTIPLTEAYVYARANGYLKRRLADIGDKVKKNQLLAVIEAPDLDAQVAQAREQVRQAEQQVEQQRSQLALATVTVERYRVLVRKGVFSRQEGDQQEANYASQTANLAGAQRNVEAFKANLRRAQALQEFEYVRAPFAGVVTQRNVDVGALISASGASSSGLSSPAPQGQSSSTGGSQQAGQTNNAGSSGSTNSAATSQQSPGQGGPLFGIAQVGTLRVLVSVPEGFATAIHVGQEAQLAFQEFGGEVVRGKVTRSASSIDANTRTMLAEVQVDNSKGRLIPGMYVVVTFPPAQGAPAPILITGDAVSIRHDRTMVATVVDGKIRLVPVTLGRDFGSAIEIVSGLKAGDMIVTDVTDDVVDNAAVQVKETKSADQQTPSGSQQNTQPGGTTQYGNQGLTDQNLQGKQSQENQKGQGQKPQSGKSNSSSESKP